MQRRVDEAKAMSVLPVESRPAGVASVVVQVEVVPDDVDTAPFVALGERVIDVNYFCRSHCAV